MGVFSFLKRKKPEPEIIIPEPPKECNHKWRDFPWYMEYDYDTNTGSLKVGIYEPYVCIHCKKRENVTLYQEKWQYLTEKQIEQEIEKVRNQYKAQLRPRAEIEDAIHDFQKVDRLYLEIANSLWPDRRILPDEKQSF